MTLPSASMRRRAVFIRRSGGLSANQKLTGFGEMSQLNVSIGADLREDDFRTTSRLGGRKLPMIQCPPFG